jgi:cap1 methyltransferase
MEYFNIELKMDPSRLLCQIRDSFKKEKVDLSNLNGYRNTDMIRKGNIRVGSEDEMRRMKPGLVDGIKYDELQKIKDKFNSPKFDEMKVKANPFEKIGRSRFMNRASIKLANIDAIFKITGKDQDYRQKQNLEKLTYCDLAGGPGGFTEYLQYRYPQSYGYGITLHEKEGGIPWNEKYLNQNQFEITYGDGTGNLYTNIDWFCDYVRSKTEVDLVVSDGGFEIGNDARGQEILSSRLILTEILGALRLLKTGGNFVCKVFDTISKISIDCIYLVSLCFEEIHIFKPVSSRPANSEKYLIGKKLKNIDLTPYIQLLQNANAQYMDKMMVTSLFELDQINPEFIKWMEQNNNFHLNNQRETANLIILMLEGKSVYIPEYNLLKCLAIWNLPSSQTRY